MPVELSFAEPGTFLVRGSGSVTFAEVAVVMNEALDHPRMCCGVNALVDARLVESAPSTAELRIIASDLRALRERGLGPMAIVAGSPFVYGTARMFSVFAEAGNLKVTAFRNMDDAREWLSSLEEGVPA